VSSSDGVVEETPAVLGLQSVRRNFDNNGWVSVYAPLTFYQSFVDGPFADTLSASFLGGFDAWFPESEIGDHLTIVFAGRLQRDGDPNFELQIGGTPEILPVVPIAINTHDWRMTIEVIRTTGFDLRIVVQYVANEYQFVHIFDAAISIPTLSLGLWGYTPNSGNSLNVSYVHCHRWAYASQYLDYDNVNYSSDEIQYLGNTVVVDS
jgi:hypothetical protein